MSSKASSQRNPSDREGAEQLGGRRMVGITPSSKESAYAARRVSNDLEGA